MIHGDVVTLTSKGILVHDKALQPLGIFHQSMCWGVWAANPFSDNKQHRYPNLIVSPIHPSSWPFLLQLEISMSDKEGAFADVCDLLNRMELSILYIECTTAGYTHAFCNVVAESTKPEMRRLRKMKSIFDAEHPYVRISAGAFKDAQDISNQIAAEMLAHAREVEEVLNKEKHPFLHSWEHERLSNRFLYDEREVARTIRRVKKIKEFVHADERTAYVKKQFPETATVRYMKMLSYFSMYGGGPSVPFPLIYHADSALLELEDDKTFTPESLKIYGTSDEPFHLGELPRHAVSIFNTQEKYLRLKPITSAIVNKGLTVIDVEYDAKQSDPYTNPTESSKGLFRQIGEKLSEHKVNLLHVANKSTRYKYDFKTGNISFVADIPESSYRSVEESIKQITSNPENIRGVSVLNVEAYPYPQLRLFVSLHFGSTREEDIKKLVINISREYGFEPIIAETIVEPTTEAVVKLIGRCHAFLQVVSLKAGETLKTVNFSWLSFEHGVAAGKDLPTARMVDCLHGTVEDWMQRLNIERDNFLLEFYSNTPTDALDPLIRKAVGELGKEVLSRRRAGG